MKHVLIKRSNSKEVIPLFAGTQKCEKNYSYGPTARNYLLIHFCLDGKGMLFDKFGSHDIHKGQLFIIRPDEITTYQADAINPWEYSWLAFNGELIKTFCTDRSVYSCPLEIGIKVKELTLNKHSSPFIFQSIVFSLLHELFSKTTKGDNIAHYIKGYIDVNYMNDISVESIAAYFGFERSYLYRIFKKEFGISVKNYIIEKRLSQGKSLLENGYSVKNTAFAVGYKDEFNFSKAYKERFNLSPKESKVSKL